MLLITQPLFAELPRMDLQVFKTPLTFFFILIVALFEFFISIIILID